MRDGRFHGWIERDDPFRLGRIGPNDAWRFPSFFSERTNVDASQISSLACAQWIVSVANLDEVAAVSTCPAARGRRVTAAASLTSPRVGTSVVAAKGFAPGEPPWLALTGTSMASPFVAGVAARMLQVAPTLTAAQIGGIMQRTARPLPGKTYEWADDAGFGVIDPHACLLEAAEHARRDDITDKFSENGQRP